MAQVEKPACGRCFTPTLATTKRKFSVDDSHYLINLCDKHAAMFDKDFLTWSNYGYDDEAYLPAQRMFTVDQIERQKAAAELRAKQAPEPMLPVAEPARVLPIHVEHAMRTAWSMTAHARERMIERGYTELEVLQTATHPDAVIDADGNWYGPDCNVYQLRDCQIVVKPKAKLVITCHPKRSDYVNRPAHAG